MRIGEFEFTDNGSNLHVKYVDKPIYLTTASPNNHSWVKELLNKCYGRHAFVYKAPPWEERIYEAPPVVNIEEDHDWWRGGICRPGDPKHIAQIIDEVNKAKKEKETAMDKNMKDYVGCKVLDVKFVPPHTTIFWDDGTVTRVKCSDEPYDSEKGFAMAVMKRLFGDCYFKDMKYYIEKYDGYEKDADLIKCMDGEFYCYADSVFTRQVAEIQKLTKENEELSELIKSETARADACRRDYLRMKDMYDKVVETNHKLHQDKLNLSNGYNRVNKDLYDHEKALEVLKEHNAKLIKENENLEKMIKEFSDNKEELCARIVRAEMLYRNQCSVNHSLNGRIDDLEKAKEKMAKKLAETKSLRQENVKLKLHLDALNEQLLHCRNDNYIQSKVIDALRMDRIALEKENAKYKDLVDMQKEYDDVKKRCDFLLNCERTQAEVIHELRAENEALRIRSKQIEQIKEILK